MVNNSLCIWCSDQTSSIAWVWIDVVAPTNVDNSEHCSSRSVSILSVPIKPGVLISYHSPTVVASAVIYLFISTRMKIPHCISPFLASLGKSTFSVYIMNINNIVVGLYKNRLSFVPRLSALHQPLYIYGFSALFVVVALLIDHIRRAALTIIKNIAFTIWRNLSRWNPRKISLGFLTHVEKNRI